MAWSSHDKETTQKLLRDFIQQLCRANVGNGGCYEVDGIICITRGTCGNGASDGLDQEQIVVKVHEQVNLDTPYGSGSSSCGNASVLKEYLSSHANQSSSVIEKGDVVICGSSFPPLNLKRKANDENDNAIIDVSRPYDFKNSSSWPHLKLHRGADRTAEYVLLDNESNYDDLPSDCMPQDLTKSTVDNALYDGDINGPDLHCCGSCLLDFDSFQTLQQHFNEVHSVSLEHYCSLCAVGFVNISDLMKHKSAAHASQSAVRRRKQSKPRRGMVTNVELVNDLVEDDGGSPECMPSKSPPSDCEVRSESTSSIRQLLQKRQFSKIDEDLQQIDSGKAALEVGAERTCRHCSAVFTDFQSFSVHCRSVHRRFPCPYCLQTFTQRVNRDRHLYNHTGEKPFVCHICGSAFTRKDALKKHQLKANHQIVGSENSTDEQVGIPMSGVDLSDESSEEDDVSQSEECGLDLTLGDSSLKVSKEKLKDGRINFNKSADDDLVNYDRGHTLAGNINLSGLKKSPVYATTEMSEVELSPASVKGNAVSGNNLSMSKSPASTRLRLLYSDQNRTYNCDICRESVVGATAFETHCRNLHRRTPCVYCGKTFSQKGNMERHQRQHTGERPFACPHCSSSYTRKETLKVHMNQAHPTATLPVGAASGPTSL